MRRISKSQTVSLILFCVAWNSEIDCGGSKINPTAIPWMPISGLPLTSKSSTCVSFHFHFHFHFHFPLSFYFSFLALFFRSIQLSDFAPIIFWIWSWNNSKQLIDAEEVNVVHQLDKERGITAEDCKLIKFHTSRCKFSLLRVTALISFLCVWQLEQFRFGFLEICLSRVVLFLAHFLYIGLILLCVFTIWMCVFILPLWWQVLWSWQTVSNCSRGVFFLCPTMFFCLASWLN